MRHRSHARWLAPLALVTCAVAVYVVVNPGSSSTEGSGSGSTRPASTGRGSTATTTTRRRSTTRPRTYVVKPGDVLSAIAVKTGVSVSELERLNPTIDAGSLQPGDKLKLR